MASRSEVGSVRYRCRSLSADEQWALLRKISPFLPAFQGIELGLGTPGLTLDAVEALAGPMLAVSDEISTAACEACLDAIEHLDEQRGWIAVPHDARLALVALAVRMVTAENFSALFALKRPDFIPAGSELPSYRTVTMADGEDWLWRPVLRGMCKAESLFDRSLRIEHIARANMALDVADENESRARKAAQSR